MKEYLLVRACRAFLSVPVAHANTRAPSWGLLLEKAAAKTGVTTAAKWFINENVPVKLITESSGKEFLSSSSRKIQENALYGISVATSSALGSTFF